MIPSHGGSLIALPTPTTLSTTPPPTHPLRIFYASDTTPNAWFQSIRSNIWRNNLLLPLRDLGHDVVEFDYDLTLTFRNLDASVPKQAAFIHENRPKSPPSSFIKSKKPTPQNPSTSFSPTSTIACILPDTLDAIRRMGIKTVNWYCNGSYQLDLVREISPHYDFCLVPEKFRLDDYRAIGAHPIYCQEAANPQIYKPYDLPRDYEVTFVGQAYGDRPLIIRHLIDHGIAVHLWGHGWKNPDARYLPKESYEAILAIPEYFRSDPLSRRRPRQNVLPLLHQPRLLHLRQHPPRGKSHPPGPTP